MTITVFGATGMVGKRIVEQARAAGHSIIAFGRNVEDLIDRDNRDPQLRAVKGYVFDASDVSSALTGADAVISVLGGAMDGTDKSRSLGIKNIILQMEDLGISRIVALGAMGVLTADNGRYVLDQPTYPAALRAVGQEHLLAYLYLQASRLDWTFVCPPGIQDEEGKRDYTTTMDTVPAENKNEIAAGDLAAFMLKELSSRQYLRHRVGISAR